MAEDDPTTSSPPPSLPPPLVWTVDGEALDVDAARRLSRNYE